MADLTGKRLGKYELVERLGRGGMAEVYKSYQPGMDRFVAIKVMHSHLAESEDFVTRFKREAQLVGQLRHPHIVQVIDFDVQDEGYYMVMEYIKGETLKYYIQQKGALDPDEALRITSHLADALHYAHQEGMIHRDIKPANVMFTDNAYTHPVLTDFGIARIISGGTQLTASGAFVGTPAYISPEIARGEQADERSDIYSMGIMLYEMLTGKVPYDADTPFAVIMKHVNEPLPSARQININVTDSVERVLFTALAKNPTERYQTAAEFRDALNEALGIVSNERPTVSGEGRGTELQNQATATMSRDEVDNLATFVTDSQQIAGAASPTMMGDRQKRSNLPRILAGVTALIALIALLYVFVLQPNEEDKTKTTDNTPAATATIGPSVTPELAVADVGDYDNSLLEESNLGRALSNAGIRVTQFPDDPKSYVNRAEVYSRLYLRDLTEQNLTNAEGDFNKALELDPNYNPAYLVRGKFYSDLGKYDLALADFNHAIELDPDSAELYAQRGMVYFLQGNQGLATTDFVQATTLDASNSLAYLGQAHISLKNGDVASTFATLSLALETDPEFAEAYALRGALNFEEGNYDEAKTDFDRAITLNDRLTDAYVGRAMYFEEEGNIRLATRDYTTALSQRQSADVYLLRAELYLDQGETNLAEADLQAALMLDDTLVGAYLDLAQIEEDEEHNELSVESYSRALELDETLDDARLSRAWLYFDLEDYEAAGADFAYLFDKNNENIEANLGLGDLAVEAENFEIAISYYDNVLAQDNEYAAAYFGRGLAYSQLNDYERAITNFNAAIENEYEDASDAYFERGLVQQELGNIEDAVLDFTESIDKNPDYAPAYLYRGIANYEDGNIEIALADFNQATELGVEDDDVSDLLKYRGISLSLTGDYEAALADFEAVLAGDAENEEVLYYRATAYIALEQYDSAIDDLTTLIENNYDELGLAYMQRGIAFRENGNSDRAIQDFDRAIDLGGDNDAIIYFQRGLTYYNSGQTEQAEADFSSALDEDDSLSDAYYFRGNIYLNKDEYELALDDLTLAIENEYDPLEYAYVTRGVVHHRLGDDDEAIRDYTEAIKQDPTYALAYYNRGLAYETQEDYQRAVDNFTLAIENEYFSPSNVYYERGLVYDSLGDYASARDDYTEVINLADAHVADAYYERGRMHYFLGDYRAAVEDNTTLLDLEYDARESIFNNRGVAYVELGEYELAIGDFDAAIQIDENYALAYANRGLARRLSGDYERAIEDYLQAEEAGYNNTYNLAYGLGISYYNLEQYEQALANLNTALDVDPEDVDALLARGRTHVALGNVGAAIRTFDEVIALDIENVDAYYERGLVFISEENWDDAIGDFENVLLLDAANADAYFQLGFANKELGNPAEALINLNRAVQLNSALSNAYYLMGDIHFEAGNLQLALLNYDQYVELEGIEADPRAVQRIAQLESALGDEARATPVPSGDDDDDDSTTPVVDSSRVPYGPAVVLATDDSTVAVKMSIVRGIAVNTDLQQALNELNGIIEEDGETVPYVALRAELNLRLGNIDEAVADANQAIELNPEHPAGYLVLAVYHTIYEYDEERALELGQLALSFAPNNGYVAMVYADIQNELGRYDQALELYNVAEELDVPIVNILVARSTLYFNIGDYENAITDGERLLELNEFSPELSLTVAGAYMLNAQYAEAEEVVRTRVVRWGTEDVEYYTHAAYVAYRNGDTEQAREWVSNTLAVVTDYPPAVYVLALVDTAEGNYDDALTQFEFLREYQSWEYSGFYINPRYGHDLAVDTAQVYRLQDDTARALEVLDNALVEDPGNGMLYLTQADILTAQDNFYGAQWNYLYVLTSTYDFDVAQLAQQRILAQGPALTFDLAYLLLNRFDTSAAWVLIEPALTQFPENSEFRWLQARYLIQENQIQEATILGEALILEDEMSPYGYLIQADLAWYANDQAQYVVLTEQAFSRDPEQPYVAFEHARAMRYTNQVNVALNIYASAEFNGLNKGLLYYERGLYFYELLRYEDASANLNLLTQLAGEYTPSDAITILLASTMQLDNYDEAGRLAGEYIEIKLADWEMPVYYANLAFVTFEAGDYDLANSLVERALEAQSDNSTARYVMALLMFHNGDLVGAHEIFMDLDENTNPYDYNDPFINVEFGHLIWFDWGNVEMAQENYEHAVELYTRAIDETYEEWFSAFVGRGQAWMALGNFADARTDLNRALIMADDLPESKAMIEGVLQELNEREANAEPAEEPTAEPTAEATPAE